MLGHKRQQALIDALRVEVDALADALGRADVEADGFAARLDTLEADTAAAVWLLSRHV